MGNYRKLQVWQKSKDLAVLIYKLTSSGPFCKDFSLKDQIQRAIVSVPSNIAEGDELDTNSQSIRHFYIAKGSIAEVLTQAIIAQEIGYITQYQLEHIEQECTAIAGMLTKLIQARKNS